MSATRLNVSASGQHEASAIRLRRIFSAFHQTISFEAVPKIFGALLDGLVAGLKNLTGISIKEKPRMADFMLWAEACTRAYWPAGTFIKAYRAKLESAVEVVLEASPVGTAVRRLMANRNEWKGTAQELLLGLTPLVGEQAAKERDWPKQPEHPSRQGAARRPGPAQDRHSRRVRP